MLELSNCIVFKNIVDIVHLFPPPPNIKVLRFPYIAIGIFIVCVCVGGGGGGECRIGWSMV